MIPRAAIIIPHKDDPVRLARCLAALPRVEGVEVIVVDNGSSQPVEVASARLVHEPIPGAAAARNRGVAATDAPLLLFLDADCLPAPDWVRIALTKGSGPVGGQVSVFHEGPRPLTGAQAFEAVFAFDNARYISQEGFSVTANMVVSRHVFEAVGPFRDAVSEDKDWGHRARAAGFPVTYAADLKVGHPSRPDWPALRRKWHRLTREASALQRAQGAGRLGWRLKALALPLSVPAHAPRVMAAPDLSLGEKARALATLARLRVLRMIWMLRG